MKETQAIKNRTISVIKMFFIFLFGVVFVIGASIALRFLCATKFIKTFAQSPAHYLQTTSDINLYKNNNLTEEIIIIPSGYFAKVINSTGNLARVEYNEIVGYIDTTNTISNNTPDGIIFETATLYTRSDAGTHLRANPSTNSNKLALIPAGSTLTYIGKISGEIPSDGTSPVWYYVHFNQGETTVQTGYVYSERTLITNLSTTPTIASPEQQPVTTTPTTSEPEQELEAEISSPTLSSGLKIFLVILFSVLGIIIFALLLISPKGDRKKRAKKHSINPVQDTPPTPIKQAQTPAYNQPEFGNFVEFTQPKEKKIHHTSFIPPSKSNSHKKQIKIKHFQSPQQTTSNQTLPPSIAKYFKTEIQD